ncbi:hypothetical protein E5288_WYG011886 [Bos mutus]|uniref:Uncharacterized protein n=1 Tax=Bos mutus TaxID=72004 RepID=A0A6B0QXC1_9CETA|nr:hypothetical protein [Bos mutus]
MRETCVRIRPTAVYPQCLLAETEAADIPANLIKTTPSAAKPRPYSDFGNKNGIEGSLASEGGKLLHKF